MVATMLSKQLLLKWSDGNKKLKKTDTVSFNLPAIEACPQAGACASICYATQGAYVYPKVKAARAFNFEKAKGNIQLFKRELIHDLRLIKQTSIQIHDSGDFFKQEYLEAWILAARWYPEKQFYCYTKSLHLDWSRLPKNFTMVQSVGGKLDHLIDRSKPHSRIFATDQDRINAGYCDGNTDDSAAQRGETLIGLTYHGTKNLTETQRTVTFK